MFKKKKDLEGHKNREENDDCSYRLLADIPRHTMFTFLGFRDKKTTTKN